MGANGELPTLLLSLSALSVGAPKREREEIDLVSSDDEAPPVVPGAPPPPAQAAVLPDDDDDEEDEAPPPAAPAVEDNGLWDQWYPNDKDSSSERTLAQAEEAQKRRDRGADFNEDAIVAEVESRLFARLSSAVAHFGNDKGEPTDWDFESEDKHKAFPRMGNDFRVDQPSLQARWDNGVEYWKIDNHEGRHRAAWVWNHLHYTSITIVVGLSWDEDDEDLEDFKGAEDGDRFLEQETPAGSAPLFVKMIRNPRLQTDPNAAPWLLIEFTSDEDSE